MIVQSSSKGKKRACQEIQIGPSSVLSVKKPKRAETRQCPICFEHIPVRLLSDHCELENERVEKIMRAVGSLDVFGDSEDGIQFSRARRSATKARKAFQPRSGRSRDSTEQTEKTIRAMKRHRKQRYNRLREMTRQDEDGLIDTTTGDSGSTCPMCLTMIQGDPDVVEAHVDSCLAHAMRVQDEHIRVNNGDIRDNNSDEPVIMRVTDGVNLVASGFHVRDQGHQDVEHDVDVDGDDDVFGRAQFTEVDILSGTFGQGPEEVDVEGTDADDPQTNTALRGPFVDDGVLIHMSSEAGLNPIKAKMEQGKGVGDDCNMNIAVVKARQRDDQAALIRALEGRVKQLESMRVSSSLCRICLDPYVEPTVSTQCWHTCCRECWLRCLSTRLCPICKRITGAENLRRVYL